MNDMEEFLTVSETAQKLRCSIATIRRYLKDGRITGIKRSNVWLIAVADLEQFILTGKKKAADLSDKK